VTLRDQIEKTVAENRKITESADFRRLSRFYEEMKQAGVVLKRQYDLPLLDTLGGQPSKESANRLGHKS